MPSSPVDPLVRFSDAHRILVTGASSGIGAAIARLLCGLGATVIASGRDVERLSAVRELCSAPERLIIEPRDLAEDMETLPQWVQFLACKYGKLGGFVCSSGISAPIPLRLFELDQARQMLDINFLAPLLLAKGFCDRRNNSGKGAAIVFVGSMVVKRPQRAQSVYSGSKAALIEAARCISLEYAAHGVRVNCVSPAVVTTPLLLEYNQRVWGASSEERRVAMYPLGLGAPGDIAPLAAFLLSDSAHWITGQNYILDGGYTECAVSW